MICIRIVVFLFVYTFSYLIQTNKQMYEKARTINLTSSSVFFTERFFWYLLKMSLKKINNNSGLYKHYASGSYYPPPSSSPKKSILLIFVFFPPPPPHHSILQNIYPCHYHIYCKMGNIHENLFKFRQTRPKPFLVVGACV